MGKFNFSLVVLVSLAVTACAHAAPRQPGSLADPVGGESSNALELTILATNDIHGGVEPTLSLNGTAAGGMAFWAGAVSAIRQGIASKYGANGGVLLVDAGDQFQGTLISNYNEGMLVFNSMAIAGYDAAIPGNHDYDFGPIGWKDDTVSSNTSDRNPRGALLRAMNSVQFPLLSANTYFKLSLVDPKGEAVKVDNNGCKPLVPGTAINWNKAARPPFLKPYLIKNVGKLRVALIGIDNPTTPAQTTFANVNDLCFRDEAETYQEIRAQLEGKADIYVILLHNGNAGPAQQGATNMVAKLSPAPDAVIAGHTHWIQNDKVGNTPVIQSGSGGDMFGRIDLFVDAKTHKIIPAQTKSYGGISLKLASCDAKASFCSASFGPDGTTPVISYEGVQVVPNAQIQQLVAQSRADILANADAGRKIGTIAVPVIKRDRTFESPVADIMTDAFRRSAQAEIAIINTGGIRDDLHRTDFTTGDVTYEDLFRIFPFNNHGYLVGPMTSDKLLALLLRAAQGCGAYGSLMQSGLKVQYQANCKTAQNGVDQNAKLLHIETVGGEVVLDTATGVTPKPSRTFQVATLDFLYYGGSGFDFSGTPLKQDMGNMRDSLAQAFFAEPVQFTPATDGRWTLVAPAGEPSADDSGNP